MVEIIRYWFFRLKYYYSLSYGNVIPLISFCMMSATFFRVFGFSGFWVFAMLPGAVVLVIIIGAIFAKLKIQQGDEEAFARRSWMWQKHTERYEDLVRRIEELKR